MKTKKIKKNGNRSRLDSTWHPVDYELERIIEDNSQVENFSSESDMSEE